MEWVGSYNTPILMLALVVKSSYGMTTGVEISFASGFSVLYDSRLLQR